MSVSQTAPLDRSKPPAPASPPGYAFPPFHQARLDSGLRVIAARQPRFPLVSLVLLFPGGGLLTPPPLAGLASLHASLLDEGTETRDAVELAALVEGLGGAVGSGADWNVTSLGVVLLSDHLTAGLDLLAEIIQEPKFADEEIERQRRQHLAEVLRRKGAPASLGGQCFSHALYGDSAYGTPLYGTEESLARVGRDDILAFHRRHIGPSRGTLVAVGDLAPEAVIAKAGDIFASWRGGPLTAPEAIVPRNIESTEVYVIDRPGSTQTHLQLGHVGVPRSEPRHPARLLLNTLFGGKFTSRINLNLRERHGFTYGAHSLFHSRLQPGPFTVRASVATPSAGAAAREAVREMRLIRDEEITHQELTETRDYLVGIFPYTLQTIDGFSRRLEDIAIFDLPLDYYDGHEERLTRLTRSDIQEAARRYLRPDELVIVAVGPAEELAPQLEELGSLQIIESS